MGIHPHFNDMEFYELIWIYERMADQRKQENEESKKNQGNRSIADMLGGSRG